MAVSRRQHPSIVLSAAHTAAAVQYAAPQLLRDHSMVRRLAEVNGKIVNYVPWQFLEDIGVS